MLTKTKKFRVDTPNPWIELGNIVESTTLINCKDYPHIFSPLYKYKDTDVLLAEGDTVFRIVNKNWEDRVKAVKLTEYHLNSDDLELFVSLDGAESALKKRQKEKQKTYENQDVYSALERIFLHTNNSLKEKTIEDIEKDFTYINTLSIQALNILKSK